MTVQELIKLLQGCDPDDEVVDIHGDDIRSIDDEQDVGLVYLEI